MEAIKNETLTKFCGGQKGIWKVMSMRAIIGQSLEQVNRIDILNINNIDKQIECNWSLKGVSSNMRYTNRDEKTKLDITPSILGKPDSKYAALIPIRKSNEWWTLTQDERRNIFEEQSKHINYSLKYLTNVSRKLYHSKDIGEPFDFLTWFEFAPEHSDQFDELVNYLRQTEEWKYVTREIDIRLIRDDTEW
jgi:chlorite dismutase